MRKMGCRALVVGLGLAVGAALVAGPADAAVVICQKGSKLKLRIDECKAKEVAVPAAELGVAGPKGDTGADGPTNLVVTTRVNGDGTTGASHAAAGIAVTTANLGTGVSQVLLDGTGAFTDMVVTDFIINATCESENYGVANAYVDPSTLTADHADVYVYCWTSSTLNYTPEAVFVTIYKGD